MAVLFVSFLLLLPTPAEDWQVADLEVDHLPLRFVEQVAPQLDVQYYESPDLAMAFYQPVPSQGGSEAGRRGFLMLYEPFYRPETGVPGVAQMAPDMAEYLFYSILLAHLDLIVVDGGGEYDRFIQTRANELFADQAQEDRLALYVTAVASFGSHLLSLANEIERSQERGRSDLCEHIQAGTGLTRLWRQAFGSGHYQGSTTREGREVYAQQPIGDEDKKQFVRQVLDSTWTGDPRHDFGPRYCSESATVSGQPDEDDSKPLSPSRPGPAYQPGAPGPEESRPYEPFSPSRPGEPSPPSRDR